MRYYRTYTNNSEAKIKQFSVDSLKFILSYLKNRKQRTVIENFYSSWEDIIAGVLQGSFTGSLLFNIFVNDLFLLWWLL